MKKLLIIPALLASMLVGCDRGGGNVDSDSLRNAAAYEELARKYEDATSFNDSLQLLMNDIVSGLDSINAQEGLLYNIEKGSESSNRREEVKANLSAIKARLNANKQFLSQMENSLKSSKSQNSKDVQTIATLKNLIEQQEAKLAGLEKELALANEKIDNLNKQVAETQQQMEDERLAKEQAQQEAIAAENEANKVFYVIGTNKELKQKGLLEKKFLSATKALEGDVNNSDFTQADQRSLTTIPTGSKKVKIYPNTIPEDSYRLVDNANGTKTLQITDPAKFWRVSRYLIIQIN